MKGRRTKHSPAFKAKVALEAIREQETMSELSKRYKIHANQIYKWKRQLLANIERAFEIDEGSTGDSPTLWPQDSEGLETIARYLLRFPSFSLTHPLDTRRPHSF
jgi:transposase-like protein